MKDKSSDVFCVPDTAEENPSAELRGLADSLVVWGSAAELEGSLLGLLTHGVVIVSKADDKVDRLAGQSFQLLHQLIVENGVHLVVYPLARSFFQELGLKVQMDWCPRRAARQMSGGGFEHGPAELPGGSVGSECTRTSSLPQTTDGVYGDSGNGLASAWTTPYGKGRITYFGSPYREMPLQWRWLLASALNTTCTNSSLKQTTDSNATTSPIPAAMVECGSVVHGAFAGASSKHVFCTPEDPGAVGEVLLSTCTSSFDTTLKVTQASDEQEQRSCDDCGECGAQAEMKLSTLVASTCYDIAVGQYSKYSPPPHAGNYTLWVSCCDQSLCHGRGQVTHRGWGPPGTPDAPSVQPICGCDCTYPFAGPSCSECDPLALATLNNNSCESCFAGEAHLAGLEGYSLMWSPDFAQVAQVARDSACSGISVDFSYSYGVSRAPEPSRFENGSFGVGMPPCPYPMAGPVLYFYANSWKVLGTISCAQKISCDFSLDPNTLPGSRRFAMQMLAWSEPESWRKSYYAKSNLAALSLLELLLNTFSSSSGTYLVNDIWGNSFNASFNASLNSSLEAAQGFFNKMSHRYSRYSSACSWPDLAFLESSEAPELLILVGPLCQGAAHSLEALVRVGTQILHLDNDPEPMPPYITSLDVADVGEFGLAEFPQSALCDFFDLWLRHRSVLPGLKCSQDPVEGLHFTPSVVPAFHRSQLEFPELCPIKSCCVGELCSSFTTSVTSVAGDTASCHTPLMEMGVYNISVEFWDGSRLFAPKQLSVRKPSSGFYAERMVESQAYPQSIFKDWSSQIYHSGRWKHPCCDMVAIGFDLAVMGRLDSNPTVDTATCQVGEFYAVPAPIEHERPFPKPVRFMALRCFEGTAGEDGEEADGSSCELPRLPHPNASDEAAEDPGAPTWNWQQKARGGEGGWEVEGP